MTRNKVTFSSLTDIRTFARQWLAGLHEVVLDESHGVEPVFFAAAVSTDDETWDQCLGRLHRLYGDEYTYRVAIVDDEDDYCDAFVRIENPSGEQLALYSLKHGCVPNAHAEGLSTIFALPGAGVATV
jgi:hypothetical protein